MSEDPAHLRDKGLEFLRKGKPITTRMPSRGWLPSGSWTRRQRGNKVSATCAGVPCWIDKSRDSQAEMTRAIGHPSTFLYRLPSLF